MQTWAKRGFQSALVTGGLLVLGTGTAAAGQDVANEPPSVPGSSSLGTRGAAVLTDGGPAAAESPAGDVRGAGKFSGDLVGGETLSGDVPAANLPPRVMTLDGVPTRTLPNAGESSAE